MPPLDYPPSNPPYPSPPSHGHARVSYRREPNFLQRVGNSVVGSVIGVMLVAGACVMLFWNEGRSIHTYDMLVEARGACNPLRSSDHVYDTLSNKLVYVSGRISTVEPLIDQFYAINKQAVKLRRKVEMYQWIEESETREFKEPDGTVRTETHYTYSTTWRDQIVLSRNFDDRRFHDNPTVMPVERTELTAANVRLGAFSLAKDAVLKIGNWKRLMLDPSATYGRFLVYNNMIHHGNPHYAQVGDVRVWFEYAGDTEPGQEDEMSIVARQSPGAVLSTFTTPSGYDILLLYTERMTMDEVFSKEHASNKVLTWVLRAVGALLMFVGFNITTGILVTLVDWLPVVRELLAISVVILCLVLTTSLSMLVIAIAWIRYRPIYGLAVLVGACVPFIVPWLFPAKRKDG